ncbi:MAG: glycosyltransferase [Desulfomonile tiedjei]|uniref:Glycosyltransferase n=1 Tax=Desulfomonile tiedjei TaxID=2358 RepID=A0A9D6Z1C7_9BACT|nr:glycosyltransferase [Desulfomonile tiedjei]
MPLVTVIIPTYNRALLVRRAIRSVLRQTFPDFEVIVVDDGSDDSTPEVLDRFGRSIKWMSQKHSGVSAARNTGIEQANGRLLAFLDSDDEWRAEKLARQVALFKKCRKTSFICHTDEIWKRDGKVVSQKKIHRKQGGSFFERALELCLISPSSVMISRSLLDEVGWFDTELIAAEDYDLWLRITAFHEVDFVPEPLVVKHGGGPDQLSMTTPAIDTYRIRAILKILADPRLTEDYRKAAVKELIRKCKIVYLGCLKKGKIEDAQAYLELAESFHTDDR